MHVLRSRKIDTVQIWDTIIMPAFLLSSAPGNNAALPGLSLLTKNPDSSKALPQTTDLAGSFGESLSASMASLVKVSQSDNPDMKMDLSRLSDSLEELSAQLEKLDPELFEALRSFLNGQDLSPQGLESLQKGGELPDFFTTLQSTFALENNMESLTELELSALDSSIGQISALIQQQVAGDEVVGVKSDDVLPGFAFTIGKDGKVQLVHGAKPEMGQDLNQQASSVNSSQIQTIQSQTSQTQAPQNGQTSTLQNQSSLSAAQPVSTDPSLNAGLNNVVTEGDKAFNEHFELLKSEVPADVAESLLENGSESKEKLAVSGRFTDQTFKTLTEPFKPYSTTVMTPVDANEWTEEVGQKIVWFTGRNIQAAEMHLNPADLGPIEVKINVQNDVASVSFNVQNSSVRELLESNVVRLREMMESNGVNLGDVNVDSGTQDAYREAQQNAQGMGSTGGSTSGEIADDDVRTESVSVKSSNIVDYFV